MPDPSGRPQRNRPARARRGLRMYQLFALVILPLAALAVAFALGGSYLHQQAMRRMVGERDALAVRAAANALQLAIEKRAGEIRGLAMLAEESPASMPSVLDSADYLRDDFDIGLALISPDGRLLAFSGSAADWETLLAQYAESTATEGLRQVSLEEQTILLAYAQASGGGVAALGAFSAQDLGMRILDPVLPPESKARIFLVDSGRTPIFDRNRGIPADGAGDHAGVAEALAGDSGTMYLRDGGEEHVVTYSPVPAAGWALVMEENWQSVATPLSRTSEAAPLALIPVLALALAGIGFGLRQIVLPIQALEKQAASLADGNYRAIAEPVGGIAEIRHLQAGLEAMAARVQAAQENLHGYIGAITNAQEEERLRLARELHDDTLQALIALKQRIQLAQQERKDAQAADALRELEELAEGTIRGLHRLTRNLRPAYLEDLGLVPALEMLAREAGETAGIPVRFRAEGGERRLPAPVELALYRMAQEGLSNVARHARAARAGITIRFEKERIELEVADDGIGFDLPMRSADFAAKGHFGLLGMNERADLIGARLTIDSTPGQGTRLRISLPVSPPPEGGRTAPDTNPGP